MYNAFLRTVLLLLLFIKLIYCYRIIVMVQNVLFALTILNNFNFHFPFIINVIKREIQIQTS